MIRTSDRSTVKYKLYFYDFFGNIRGIIPIDAPNEEAALVVATSLARSEKSRRSELRHEDRVIMRRSFPEASEDNDSAD